MEKEYQSRAATTSNAVLLANNNFTALKITVGTLLLPTIVALSRKVGTLLAGIRAFTQAHPLVFAVLTKLAAIVAVVTGTFGALLVLIAGLLAPFSALALVAGALGLSLLPIVGTAAAIVVGVTALAAAVYLLYSSWGAIAGFFGRVWATIRSAFAGGLSAISGVVDRFRAFGANIAQGIINGITGRFGALKSTIVNMAQSAVNWFKTKLGIRSPSRVFHGFGGFLTQGLAQGIAAGADEPIAQIAALSRRLANGRPTIPRIDSDDPGAPAVRRLAPLSRQLVTALSIGAAAPAVAAASAERAGPRAAAPAALGPISITIQQQPGQDGKDLARLVREEIERLRRSDATAARSSYRDDPDHGGFV